MATAPHAKVDLSYDLMWSVRLSHLYHHKRERFLDGIDRFAKGLGVCAGAAAWASLTDSKTDIGALSAMLLTFGLALALVYDPAGKARKHAELAKDFKQLEGRIRACEPCSADLVRGFESEKISIEAGEFAALGALVTHCHNQLCTAYDLKDGITPLPWHQNLMMNICDWDQSLPDASKVPCYKVLYRAMRKRVCEWFLPIAAAAVTTRPVFQPVRYRAPARAPRPPAVGALRRKTRK